MFLGLLTLLFAIIQKLAGTSLSDTGATIVGMFLILTGVQLFVSGVLVDILIENLTIKTIIYINLSHKIFNIDY